MEWIGSLAKQFRQRKERDLVEVKSRLKEIEVYEAAIDEWWAGLVADIRSAVEEFNRLVEPDDRINVEDLEPESDTATDRGIRLTTQCDAYYSIRVGRFHWRLLGSYINWNDDCPLRYLKEERQHVEFAIRTRQHHLEMLDSNGKAIPKEQRAQAVLAKFFSTL